MALLPSQATGATLPVSLKEFKAPKPRPSTVARTALRQTPLDEDTYTAALQRIVERDYFPELPFLRAKQALEDALHTRDPQQIRAAYSQLRKCSRTPTTGRKLATPGRRVSTGRMMTPGTPGSYFSADNDGRDSVSNFADDEEVEEDQVEKLIQGRSLDQFAARFTSEDNFSASEVMLKDAVRLEENRAWVHNHAAEHNMRQQLLLKHGPRQEDGTLNMLMSAPYDEKQSLMHYVPATEYKAKESVEEARRPPKSFSPAATRVGKAFLVAQESVAKLAAMNDRELLARATSEVPQSPQVNGFGFVCTPSPCPGVDDDPIFTFGSVQGTPLMLAEDDCPGFNPFKLQSTSLRERLGVELAHKKGSGPGIASRIISKGRPTSGRMHTPGTPGTPRLSEAARRLAKRTVGAMAGELAADPQLRASYRRATPHGSERRGTPHTPLTPRSGRRSPQAGPAGTHTPRLTAASAEGPAPGPTRHLTDGLLEL